MANEKRLIDANALPISKEYCVDEAGFGATFYVVHKDAIDNAPTVDAVEVVHGRWEDEHGGKYANPRYRCSVCKEKALFKFERDCLGNHKEVQALTPNCPYCMAKLDGGKGE